MIPLGTKQIEVVLAEVPIGALKLDPTNPRIQYLLETKGLGSNVPQEKLRELLWDNPEVKKLKRSIQLNGGLIEPIVVSGKDGTVPEGNCRLTGYLMLHTEFPDDERWSNIRARILPPEVTRNTLDELLGELHIAGKNEWTPFEQAAHLFRMSEKGFEQGQLAQSYRMSKSYVVAKLRAYRLMRAYLEKAHEARKEIKDVSQKWSWFEEFYKKCKPNKENPARVYNGEDLEQKFCEWVLNNQLPQAADVRKLYDCLEDKKAIALLDKGASIEKAHEVVAANRPELTSKLWKQIEEVTDMLNDTPMSEIDALRAGDDAKVEMITGLLQSVKRVMSEGKLKH